MAQMFGEEPSYVDDPSKGSLKLNNEGRFL